MNKFIGGLSICAVILFAACGDSSTASEQGSETDNHNTPVEFSSESDMDSPELQDSQSGNAAIVNVEDGMYVLNKVKPKVTWAAEKLIGGGHEGTLHIETGKFKIQNGIISDGIVVFDMTKIAVTDLEGEEKASLEGHLRSGDFFNVDAEPKATLLVKNIINDDTENILNGALTMNGVEVEYSIPVALVEAELPGEEIGLAIQGKFYLDRTKHNITYHSQSFDESLDWFINDEVAVGFSVIGTLAK